MNIRIPSAIVLAAGVLATLTFAGAHAAPIAPRAVVTLLDGQAISGELLKLTPELVQLDPDGPVSFRHVPAVQIRTVSVPEENLTLSYPITLSDIPENLRRDMSRREGADTHDNSPAPTGKYAFVPHQRGFYLGVSGLRNRVGGGFDGTKYLSNGTVVALVPEILPASGALFYAGIHPVEIGYSRVNHTATVAGLTTPATNTLFLLSADQGSPLFSLSNLPAQGYLAMSVLYSEIVVQDGGVYRAANGQLASYSPRFTGLGFEFGGGLRLHLARYCSVSAGVVMRLVSYRYVTNGQGEELEIEPLMPFGLMPVVSLTVGL